MSLLDFIIFRHRLVMSWVYGYLCILVLLISSNIPGSESWVPLNLVCSINGVLSSMLCT